VSFRGACSHLAYCRACVCVAMSIRRCDARQGGRPLQESFPDGLWGRLGGGGWGGVWDAGDARGLRLYWDRCTRLGGRVRLSFVSRSQRALT
jgi:hypothetical protein